MQRRINAQYNSHSFMIMRKYKSKERKHFRVDKSQIGYVYHLNSFHTIQFSKCFYNDWVSFLFWGFSIICIQQ